MIERIAGAVIDTWPLIRLAAVMFTWVFLLETANSINKSLRGIEQHLRRLTEDKP
jgi:hypothetical protein